MRPAAATLLALLVAAVAWVLGAPLLDALGLDGLGLPARLGLVFLALGLAERILGRLAPIAGNVEGEKHG
jgi:hypothetical protein